MEEIRAKTLKRVDTICKQNCENLRSQLKGGALQRTKRDLELAEDWFNMERMDKALQISLAL